MAKLRPATQDDYPTIKKMYFDEGFGSSTIAIRLGCSQHSVMKLIKENGIMRKVGSAAFKAAAKKSHAKLNAMRGNHRDTEFERKQRRKMNIETAQEGLKNVSK